MDTEWMDVIQECIKGRAGTLLKAQQEKTAAVPLYPESLRYAKAHGEVELWQSSRKANVDCCHAIEAAIREGYDGRHFTPDIKSVLNAFGQERVSYVLAATLQSKVRDKRFSSENQAWAASIPMIEPQDSRSYYIIGSHSTLLESFVCQIREEMEAMRVQAEKKPSIKGQLAAKPVSGDQPTKPKDREAR